MFGKIVRAYESIVQRPPSSQAPPTFALPFRVLTTLLRRAFSLSSLSLRSSSAASGISYNSLNMSSSHLQ